MALILFVMSTDLTSALERLSELEDPAVRAANEKRGDDHGGNLSRLRALAKSIRKDHALAVRLWDAGDTAAQLLALLVCTPRKYTVAELDSMVRSTRAPKVHDWFVNYVAKKSPHAEELRQKWLADADQRVASVGWALTAQRVVKDPEGLDLDALLTRIEGEMRDAPADLQWSMNETLAQIGIHHPALRARAVRIGEDLQVLADYPTSPGCTSPFAPVWIAEMVRRSGE
ncbi:DNA alkylation repair protein [Brevibacterium salitolerans]|uniref:DNA alkylation repair protein n=2 Tax=Brevibacterium salitolerans TaxID=1403566 RepID=A0ABN2WRC7_9MICO